MKNANKKILTGEVMHVYQRAIHGFNVFYTQNDYLVFYTIFSIFVKRFNIVVLSMCIMVDHFHALLICQSRSDLSKFVSAVTSLYARMFNRTVERKGQLFDKSFGCAPKISDKKVRSVIPYVFNNPVERGICSDPMDYRWNFLAYLSSDHPFSERLALCNASKALKRSVSEVSACFTNGLWLNHNQISRLYRPLSPKEQAQLTDYIVQTYFPFDKQKLLSYYKSLEMMNLSIVSTTGAEYDIKEDSERFSDKLYIDMERYMIDELSLYPKSVLAFPTDKKIEIANRIAAKTMARNRQIAKYLHLVLERRTCRDA